MLSLQNMKKGVILAPYTTYKIGGKADCFYTAKNTGDLVKIIGEAEKEKTPYFILGTGANILIGDKGFRGLVIHNQAENFSFQNNLLIAESGATISELIEETAQRGLSGLEHFVGIPSSVGGAIRQNLHFLSPDRQNTIFIKSIVESGLVLEEGEVKKVNKDFFKFGYDDSILHHRNVIVLEITLKLTGKDSELIKKQIQENLAWRNEKQPQLREFPSCGSVFRKIDGVGAGRLIEQAGLKGKQIGGAKVSEKHANYIVNMGDATADDVRRLISLVQSVVLKKTGYKLEPEIGFVGEF